MQLTSDLREVVVGSPKDAVEAVPLPPFDERVLDFFNELSRRLTKVRDYSDVATFGFWCRRAALLKEKNRYDDLHCRLGKGVVFHSTPSNVPVNFAFSFAAGLLAGNANIVRLPGKDFTQVQIIIREVEALLTGEYAALAPYLCFVKYSSTRELHDQYSAVCDVRVIWGGDGTINELRQSPLKPRATELTFADRYSAAIIQADEYLKANDKQKIAQDFYNDTYFSDQNACTAPRIIFWMGENKAAAKKIFWDSIKTIAREKYELAPVQAVGKLAAFYKVAAEHAVALVATGDSYVSRVKVTHSDAELMRFKYNSGFFFEHDINGLKDLLPISGERLQTLTYYGVTPDELKAFFTEYRPKGIDRAVPIGKSMDFSLIWDGYDLIDQFTRKVVVRP